MELDAYLKKAGRGSGVALARAVRVHPVMVSQWASGAKSVPVCRCVPIEVASGGAVRRWDLRPVDWHTHWPELIGTPGAPEPGHHTSTAVDEAPADHHEAGSSPVRDVPEKHAPSPFVDEAVPFVLREPRPEDRPRCVSRTDRGLLQPPEPTEASHDN